MSDHSERRRILAILANKLDPDDYQTVVEWIADREQIIEDSQTRPNPFGPGTITDTGTHEVWEP